MEPDKYINKKFDKIDMPNEFPQDSIKTIKRLVKYPNVVGILYFRNHAVQMTTVPESMVVSLGSSLPCFSAAVYRAIAEITASINEINPIVDRIMDDDSVESVIMTNNEGNPILTNANLMGATTIGLGLHRLGTLVRRLVCDLDPFDELLILRVNTKTYEAIAAPHSEFDLIVIQHARHIRKMQQKKD